MAQGTLLKSCYLGVNKRCELGFRIGTEVGFYKGTDGKPTWNSNMWGVVGIDLMSPFLLQYQTFAD